MVQRVTSKVLARLRYTRRTPFFLSVLLSSLSLFGCAVRPPVPLGTVPPPPAIRGEDEREGQEALGELSREYELSRNDAAKDRVDQLVARLAAASGADSYTPWHVTVFNAPEVKNAAAPRGNFLFVWSGLLEYLRSDEELAVVLAHELGHILAGHVMPHPSEVATKAVAHVGGALTSTVVGQAAGMGLAGDLAGQLAELAIEAMVVNPNQRRLETEADEIGMFLLAKAGYDPDTAINFWERVQNDPAFGAGALQFLSTHPSGEDRFKHLERIRDLAQNARQKAWRVRINRADIYSLPSRRSDWMEELPKDSFFFGNDAERGWICGERGCVDRAALEPL